MSLTVKPIRLFGTSPDKEGALVSCNGSLVAVFLQLSHIHDDNEGRWFVEWGSSPEFANGEIFPSLATAVDWLTEQMKGCD